jgi:hypothetical protein
MGRECCTYGARDINEFFMGKVKRNEIMSKAHVDRSILLKWMGGTKWINL